MSMLLKAVASVAATCGGCAPVVTDDAPTWANCPPGEIVIESGEEVGCDLVGPANTLTVLDVDLEWCDHYGGVWKSLAPFPAGECTNVNF